jgi:hypothetical protein
MRHSILLLLLTAFFLRPSLAQELGEDVDDLKLAAISPTKVRLSWAPLEPADRETSVSYSVFRGTTETFVPSTRNRIASGLTKNSYVTDDPSRNYYYYVKVVTTAKQPSAMIHESECHALILMLGDQVERFDPSSHTNAEERLAGMQRLLNWTEELDNCVLKSPSDLSIKDWQNAVFLDSQLTRKFDDENEAGKAEEGQHTLQANYDLFKTDRQQWLNEYNDLVHKYNDLVRDYNGQRDLIIRLVATPPPLSPARTFVHCSTFNFGSVGSIDCY